MSKLSDNVNRKFIDSVNLSDWEIETDTGWEDITYIHKTVPYTKWSIKTENELFLECADDHIVFDENFDEIYVKNLIPFVTFIQTKNGPQRVVSVVKTETQENMFDISVNSSNHRFYTNDILSHNSILLETLTFSLFGKSFRGINKPQLVNSLNNGDLLVEIEFNIGNISWKVKRGLKPSIFKIYRNDTLLDRYSSVIDQQNWFEENVIKMNYKSFTQIVILGTGNFTPFMQMTPSHRREVVEDLLDIKIFSLMNDNIKSKIKNEKEKILTQRSELNVLNEKIRLQTNYIDQINKKTNDELIKNRKKIDTYQERITELQDQNVILTSNADELKLQITDRSKLKTRIKKLNLIRGKVNQKISRYKSELEFFKQNEVCPTCTQSIENEFRLNRIGTTEEKVDELDVAYKEIEATLRRAENDDKRASKLTTNVTEVLNEIYKNNIRISEYQQQIIDIETEIQEYSETSSDRDIEHENLINLKQEKENIQDIILSIQELITYYNYTAELLKDKGIKAQVIKNYLPFINQQICNYLKLMGFPINFFLNEEFEEEVISPIHDNYSYSSFSEGERQRIDLALLFTWRDLAKVKNSISTNLLLLDEILDSSLDGEGITDFMSILKFFIKDCNIFIISHKDSLIEKFDKIIKVEKVGNYSVYT